MTVSSIELNVRFKPLLFSLLACLFCLLTIWVGQSFLAFNQEGDSDNSYFIYGGQYILQGGDLYGDFWDQKPPGIFWVNALLLAIFGLHFKAWAFICGLLMVGFLLVAGLQFKKIIGWPLALMLVTGFCFTMHLNIYYDYGNRPEFYMSLMDFSAFLMAISFLKSEKGKYLFWCGLLSGLASLFKPVGMACFLSVLAFLMICYWKADKKKVCVFVLLLVVGFLCPLALTLIYFGIHGHAVDYLRATFLVPLQSRGGGGSLLEAGHWMVLKYGPIWGLVWPALLLPFLLRMKTVGHKDRQLGWLSVLFLCASLSGILIQKKGFPHYFMQGVGPLVVASMLSCYLLCQKFKWKPAYMMVPIFILTLWTAKWTAQKQWQQYVNLDSFRESNQIYSELANWLSNELKDGEKFFYLANGYQPYIQSGHQAPYRCSPFIVSWGVAGADLFMKDLMTVKKQKIVFIIENKRDKNLIYSLASGKTKEQSDAIKQYENWLDAKFEIIPSQWKDFEIYKLKKRAL